MPANYWGEYLENIRDTQSMVHDGLKNTESPIVLFETALTESSFEGPKVDVRLPSLILTDGSIGGVLEHGTFLLEAGEYVSHSSLIVSENATLIVDPGVTIAFNQTGIYVGRNGTLHMEGNPVNKISLLSASKLILHSSAFTRIAHVYFDQMLDSFWHTGWGGIELDHVDISSRYNTRCFFSEEGFIYSSSELRDDNASIVINSSNMRCRFGGLSISQRLMDVIISNSTFSGSIYDSLHIFNVKSFLLVDSLVRDGDNGFYSYLSRIFWEANYHIVNNTFLNNNGGIDVHWTTPNSLLLSGNVFRLDYDKKIDSVIKIDVTNANLIEIENNNITSIETYHNRALVNIDYRASSTKVTSGLIMNNNIFRDCKAENILVLDYISSQRLTNIANIFAGELHSTSKSEPGLFLIKGWPKSFSTMTGNIFTTPYIENQPYVRVETDDVPIIDASESYWNTNSEEEAKEQIYYESSDSAQLQLYPILNSSGIIIEHISSCNTAVLEADIPAASVPFSGSFIGGTVIFIQNLHFCVNDPNVEVYCRFNGFNVINHINPAEFAFDKIIGCKTPYSGRPGAVEVSFTTFDTSDGIFAADDAIWVSTANDFQYFEAAKSVVVGNFSFHENIDTPIQLTWDNDGLRELVYGIDTVETVIGNNIAQLGAEVLLYDKELKLFKIIDSFNLGNIDEEVNTAEVTLNAEKLLPYTVKSGNRDWVLSIFSIFGFIESEGTRMILAQQISDILPLSMLPQSLQAKHLTGCASVDPCFELLELREELPCPPNFMFAEIDDRFDPGTACPWPPNEQTLWESFGCDTFHEGAGGCFRGTASNGAGQQCCYSDVGPLITDPWQGAGTEDCASAQTDPVGHFFDDVIPYLDCCLFSSNKAECQDYYDERPPTTSEGYRLPSRGNGWGDPHIRTIDGFEYDFNGAGEYVALCGILNKTNSDIEDLVDACKPSSKRLISDENRISIHFLFEPFGVDDLGTVTVGVGIIDPTHEKGGRAITVLTHDTSRIIIKDGSKSVLFPRIGGNPKVDTAILKSGVVIKKSANLTSVDTSIFVQMSFPSGLKVHISEVGGVMLPTVSRVFELSSFESIGLYGYPDGDKENDLIASSGLQIDISDISGYTSIPEKIFYDFGQSWMIEDEECSVFQDVDEINFDEYHKENYVPIFEAPEMSPELQAQADKACGDLSQETTRENCYFDIAVTKEAFIFESVSIGVKKEEFAIVAETNSSPLIQGVANQISEINVGETAIFNFVFVDDDGDNLIATLNRNDMNAFEFGNIDNTTNGKIEVDLTFNENFDSGSYHAQIIVTDGISPVMSTATVSIRNKTSLPVSTISPSSIEASSLEPTGSMEPTVSPRSLGPTSNMKPTDTDCPIVSFLTSIPILGLILNFFSEWLSNFLC